MSSGLQFSSILPISFRRSRKLFRSARKTKATSSCLRPHQTDDPALRESIVCRRGRAAAARHALPDDSPAFTDFQTVQCRTLFDFAPTQEID